MFVLMCCLSLFRISVPTHLSTAFPVVSSEVPPLPAPGVPSQTPPALPSVCQEGLCHNGGTCRPLSLPTGATSFQCDCPLHFTGRFCEKGNWDYFFSLLVTKLKYYSSLGMKMEEKYWLSYFSAFHLCYFWLTEEQSHWDNSNNTYLQCKLGDISQAHS